MEAVFKDLEGNTYTLGRLSLGWIDVRNIFDSFQEDNDYLSEVIFKTTGIGKVHRLRALILFHLKDTKLREDLKEKIEKFCDFLKGKDGITMTID